MENRYGHRRSENQAQPSRDIPFNKLVLSQSNVRRVRAGVSIEQLAESIAQRTLLQSLNVRAVVDADGHETGMFEVPAGGRRCRALELLVKQRRMARPVVPCVVRDGGIAEDDSIAENDERVGMYPLDQLRASQSLRDGGMSEEEIGARRLVTPAIVKQRLRLASGFTKLDGVYTGADGMTMPWQARELALRLAREAEAVCRNYLRMVDVPAATGWSGMSRIPPADPCSSGWKGANPARARPAKWTDAATGEHGDLLDVIRETCGLVDFHDVATEARRILSLPRPEPDSAARSRLAPTPAGSAESARRLFAMSQPVPGTLVETYLRTRGITALPRTNSLRFHPRCYYRPDQYSPTETWPAMIAAVTDLAARSQACIVPTSRLPGLAFRATARHRSTHRGARWDIFSATPFVSVR